jgi:hypothetical protein
MGAPGEDHLRQDTDAQQDVTHPAQYIKKVFM